MNDALPEMNVWAIAASALTFATMGGCIAAWVWALLRLARNRPLFETDPGVRANWRGSTAAAVLGMFLLTQFGAAFIYYAGVFSVTRDKSVLENLEMTPQIALLLTTIANLTLMLLLPWLIRRTSGIDLTGLGLLPPTLLLRDAWIGVVAFLIVSPVVYLTFYLAQTIWERQDHPVFESIQEQGAGPSAMVAILSAVVTAPIAEELVFRGAILGWLTSVARRKRAERVPVYTDAATGDVLVLELDDLEPMEGEQGLADASGYKAGPPGAVYWVPNVIVSVIFAGIHFAQWPAPVPLFLLSLTLGWLAQKTGRLGAPIALHVTFNGLATLIALLGTQAGLMPKS